MRWLLRGDATQVADRFLGLAATLLAGMVLAGVLWVRGQMIILRAEVREVEAHQASMREEMAQRTADRFTRGDHERWVREVYRRDHVTVEVGP